MKFFILVIYLSILSFPVYSMAKEDMIIAQWRANWVRSGPGIINKEITKNPEKFMTIKKLIDEKAVDVFVIQGISRDIENKIFEDLKKTLNFEYHYWGGNTTGYRAKSDINTDGLINHKDTYNYGKFRGQYDAVILSRTPITPLTVNDKIKEIFPSGFWVYEINNIFFVTAWVSSSRFSNENKNHRQLKILDEYLSKHPDYIFAGIINNDIDDRYWQKNPPSSLQLRDFQISNQVTYPSKKLALSGIFAQRSMVTSTLSVEPIKDAMHLMTFRSIAPSRVR